MAHPSPEQAAGSRQQAAGSRQQAAGSGQQACPSHRVLPSRSGWSWRRRPVCVVVPAMLLARGREAVGIHMGGHTSRRSPMAVKGNKVFRSSRREDAADVAGRIREWLVHTRRIAREEIFMDVPAILPGANFMQVIGDTLGQCRAVLVVISPSWLAQITAPDTSYGRAEAEIALDKGIPVIPVLVGGAKLPTAAQLP